MVIRKRASDSLESDAEEKSGGAAAASTSHHLHSACVGSFSMSLTETLNQLPLEKRGERKSDKAGGRWWMEDSDATETASVSLLEQRSSALTIHACSPWKRGDKGETGDSR